MTGLGKLRNEELHSLYSSPHIIKVTKLWRERWTGHVADIGEIRNAYIFLVGEPVRRRPLEAPTRI
jgi:hypothetical protein